MKIYFMLNRFYSSLSLIFSISFLCSTHVEARDYLISKGNHHSNQVRPSLFRGDSIKFKAMFDSSAAYELGDEDQLDVNKLYGASDCMDGHMESSARFGWRWVNEKLEILAFTHTDGNFEFKTLGTAEINKVLDFEIQLSSDRSSYIYKFQGHSITMDRGCRDQKMRGYKLYPYFGGNKVAPHDVSIKIEDDTDEYANFSLETVYPNPTNNQRLFLNLEVEDDLNIGFRIFDLNGRLVQTVEPVEYSGNQNYSSIPIELRSLAAGMYLIEPYALVGGEYRLGFVGSSGHAVKFIVL